MITPRLTEMNLNLLLALDALLAERSVSAAARRVGVSQPAMSQSLRQLRDLMGDELLVRDRNAMVLTPGAERLAVPLRQALVGLQRALDGEVDFDPARSRRRFVIAAGDHVAVTLLPPLLEHISRAAAGVDIELRPILARRLSADLATGDVDLAIAAYVDAGEELVQQRLYRSRFACLVRRGHPQIDPEVDPEVAPDAGLTLDQYLALPHALISPTGEGVGVVDTALAALGQRRRVALRVSSFLAAPLVVARSDLILTAPHRVALAFAALAPLTVLDPPLELPGFDTVQVWHRRFQSDPAHRWLRATVAACSPD
ncbi:LysR family transcriptional regulator [Haliangium sp.]|uniref:LysR family transcriptional regulator n=1 Tax=Haliangium sp. TaxID=2663208 RepID=UPI003D149633